MKQLILTCPGTGSTSLTKVINKYSNYKCIQIVNYDKMNHNKSLLRISLNNLIKFKLKDSFINFHKHLFYKYYSNSIVNKLRNTNPTSEYKYLRQHHSDICDFDIHFYYKFCNFLDNNPKTICKQHFPPTEFNKMYLRDFKKIIILRNTDEILNKYKNIVSSHYDYLKKGLTKELDNWRSGWINEPNVLTIEFDEITRNTYTQLKKVESFTDIKFNVSKDFKLPWENKSL